MVAKMTRPLLALALGAAALAGANPAAARDEWRGHRGGGDAAGAAIVGGIVGLAIGAAIASDDRPRYYDRRDYYYEDGYYPPYPPAYYRGGYYYQPRMVYRYRYDDAPRGYWRGDRGWRGHRRGW